MKKSKIVGTIIAAIIIIVGSFALVYNAVIVYNSDLKFLSYKNIDATIASVNSTYIDGVSYYRGVYSFNIDGIGYSCNSSYSSDVDEYVVGMTGTVRYNPKSPSNCFLADDSRTWNYLYLGISCIALIIGIKIFEKMTRVK